MNKFIKAFLTAFIATIYLAGCSNVSNLTLDEWKEKEIKMGTTYGEQLKAGNYPSSWSEFGELEKFEYISEPAQSSFTFEGRFIIAEGVMMDIHETYIRPASGNKIVGHLWVDVIHGGYENSEGEYIFTPQDAGAIVKTHLDEIYGNLDWEIREDKYGNPYQLQVVDATFKPIFTPDVVNLYYFDEEKDDVSVWESGYILYHKALKKALYS